MLPRTAAAAGMASLKVHPHALRHSTGYALINQGVDVRTLQAYLGHRNVSHTIRYAQQRRAGFEGSGRIER
jgi:type 1 fimbriae regulatory protein FimB